jgi:hypothetical protein
MKTQRDGMHISHDLHSPAPRLRPRKVSPAYTWRARAPKVWDPMLMHPDLVAEWARYLSLNRRAREAYPIQRDTIDRRYEGRTGPWSSPKIPQEDAA